MSTARQAIRTRRKAVKDTRYKPQFKPLYADKMSGKAGSKARGKK